MRSAAVITSCAIEDTAKVGTGEQRDAAMEFSFAIRCTSQATRLEGLLRDGVGGIFALVMCLGLRMV